MGQWSMHIEGHGIHDNHREDDADAILARFVAELEKSQELQSVYFTVGSRRDVLADLIRKGTK